MNVQVRRTIHNVGSGMPQIDVYCKFLSFSTLLVSFSTSLLSFSTLLVSFSTSFLSFSARLASFSTTCWHLVPHGALRKQPEHASRLLFSKPEH